MGPPILRYLLLLFLLFNGYQCDDEAPQIIQQSDIKSDPSDGYLNDLDVYHIDDQCRIARFGYQQDFYKIEDGIGGGQVKKPVDVLGAQQGCQRKKHSIFVTSEGEKYYEIEKHEAKTGIVIKIAAQHQIFFTGKPEKIGIGAHEITGNFEGTSDPDNFDVDISNCFIDLGSLYCLVGVKKSATSPKEYLVFRFTKKGSKFVHTAIYNFQIIHGGKPYHVLQDAQSGHIGVIYYPFDGHESNSIDVRSLYGFLRRGSLINFHFNARYAIGMSSKNHRRYILAHPVGGSGAHDKKYSYLRVPFGYPRTHEDEAELANWDALALDRNGRKGFGFFKDSVPDFYKLAEFASRRCLAMAAKFLQCGRDTDDIKGIQLALIIVCCCLLFVFLLFLGFLMYYLIFCVVTKRRRRRKRKHRKHRKHRKTTATAIGMPPEDGDEVDIDPETAVQEEKPPENAFVKKVKELGGVDSSSSSEDPEHSQAYFSARDQFDTKASTAVGASSKTSKKDTNKNDEMSKQSNAETPVTGGAVTPEEHDLAAGGGPQGPRSVYMKPKKKKK